MAICGVFHGNNNQARVEVAPELLDDVGRFLKHLAKFTSDDMSARIDEIVQSMQMLTHSPLIGRPVKGGKGELIIGRGSAGYVALYRFVARIATVFVLAVRSQRESDYK